MSGSRWHNFRTVIRYAFCVGCVLVVSLPILICGSLLMDPFSNPFAGFGGYPEPYDLNGRTAKRRLPTWPVGVDPGDV